MIEFDTKHIAKSESLTKAEVPAYLAFLRHQIDRHDHEARNADAMLIETQVSASLWKSAIARHRDKALAACELIATLKERFQVEEIR